MYKKITGVHESSDAARASLRAARDDFRAHMQHANHMKGQMTMIKASNNAQREILKQEEKDANAMKFTKMSKKTAFLPSLRQRALLAGEITSMDKGDPFRDDRIKKQLLQPARNTEKGIKFNLSSTAPSGCFFTKEAGREIDSIDDVLKKYYTNPDRLQTRPFKDVNGETMQAKIVGRKWVPNNFVPENVQKETPMLLDRTFTPRGAKRAISLGRNYSMKKWLYNKNTCDKFDPDRTAHEIKRSKNLRKITRRQEKQKATFQVTLEKRRTAFDSYKGTTGGMSSSMDQFARAGATQYGSNAFQLGNSHSAAVMQ